MGKTHDDGRLAGLFAAPVGQAVARAGGGPAVTAAETAAETTAAERGAANDGAAAPVPLRPLEGVTVLSLAPNLPGPWAAWRLRQWGAHVIKVESPGGDMMSRMSTLIYERFSAEVEIVEVNLKNKTGRAQLAKLADQAEILVTSMRPSAAERLGLPELADRMSLAWVEVVGSEEDPEDPGHDLTYQAANGTIAAGGPEAPRLPAVLLADVMGGERAAGQALAALLQRRANVAGGHGGAVRVKVSLEQAVRDAAVTTDLTHAEAILGGTLPEYGIYRCADGYVALAALEPHFRERMETLLGTSAEELAAVFAEQPAEHWVTFAKEHDLPIVPVT
ncbi:Far-related protein [Micrococcus lylae]|uniref:Far-related protein n=1 Tax=Micrococcus lylae TaxID=1273 RepID=A0A1R4JPN6_9MICC|nr:Far-related protein [Micrococcus lylae]